MHFTTLHFTTLQCTGLHCTTRHFTTLQCSAVQCTTIHYTTFNSLHRGTGMVVSSSNFCPHLGKVILDLFRLLHAVRHGTEALVYRDYPREAAAPLYLEIFFKWIASGVRTLVLPLNSGATAALSAVQALV